MSDHAKAEVEHECLVPYGNIPTVEITFVGPAGDRDRFMVRFSSVPKVGAERGVTSEMRERVAKALYASWVKDWDHGGKIPHKTFDDARPADKAYGLKQAAAAIEAVADDPDIQQILKWLDFKTCGWHPEQRDYIGARKLLDAFGIKPEVKE